MPTSTDLVTDLPADFEVFGQAVDTSLADLKGGTTGQVLSKASATDMDFTWTNVDPLTILDAKGDLITATAADTPARLASSGVNGQVLTVDTSASTGLKWATASTGTTWTSRQTANGNGNLISIAYNGSNLYVAVGSSGVLYSSPDGITWTSRTSGFGSTQIQKVIYGNSVWVAIGNGGLISSSSDGITWTLRTSNFSTNNFRDIHFANSLFVAVGAGGGATNTGGLVYSSDGTTWTRKSQTLSNCGDTYNSVTYNGTNWLISTVGGATANAIYASTPSGTWTEFAIATSVSQCFVVTYDGTNTWAIVDGGWFYTSSTTFTPASWAAIQNYAPASINSHNFKSASSFYNGRLYQLGYYLQSATSTPVNTNYLTRSIMEFTPFNQNASSTPFISVLSTKAFYIGSAGMIIVGSNSEIYTSF